MPVLELTLEHLCCNAATSPLKMRYKVPLGMQKAAKACKATHSLALQLESCKKGEVKLFKSTKHALLLLLLWKISS